MDSGLPQPPSSLSTPPPRIISRRQQLSLPVSLIPQISGSPKTTQDVGREGQGVEEGDREQEISQRETAKGVVGERERTERQRRDIASKTEGERQIEAHGDGERE